MRLLRTSNVLLPLNTFLLATSTQAALIPDFFQNLKVLQNVEKRCANPCGYYGQLCCASNQYCYTDANNQAQCGTGTAATTVAAGGSWQYYTTTFVQTDLRTVTTTYSSYVGAQPTATTTVTLGCAYSQGQTACGSVCCLSGQYCQKDNTCVAVPGGSSIYYSSLYTVTTIVTNTASAPVRPTTQTVLTLTSTGTASGTTAYQTPVSTGDSILGSTSGNAGHLSGGAIAGIVIGVILGIIILLLICACCCFKGLIDGLLSIFGLGGRRRRTEETIIEERHSRRTGAFASKWFGQPGRTEVIEEKKESSGFTRWLSVAAVLGGLAAILGLKGRADRKEETEYTGSSYTYDYTSASSASSITRPRSGSRR